ncbi:MBL fold metallo-hydrolase [Leisingera sp. McT4-56]|uniref:MBL fold metallo-hydrolase n=1 Tax=Leisingera sp. McT4-56 TaxID=2881255 RepID=UPI001CF886B9|nr:MBL fold metallo-hydrolase [Leisingera sp. McT4-56]MCB4457844.1 MBL fold metallo-hydrolase [Leisingera sp. McT4-56]
MGRKQQLSRRIFLYQGACLAALGSQAEIVRADLPLGSSAWITTLSDGYLSLPPEMVFGAMPQKELEELLARHQTSLSKYEPNCNVVLYRDGENTVLFDAGAGPDFMATSGKLPETFDAIGLSPDEITHVVLTHAHPDHIWGVLDGFDDPFFPKAVHLFGRKEWDYWWNPATVDSIGADRASFAAGAKRRMEAIEDQVEFFDDGQEILPGIAARAAYGHTPGHMAFEVRKGNDAVMVVGDALGNPHVAFERPGWLNGTDQDPKAAATARKSLLEQILAEQMRLVGFHLPSGGFGRVEKAGSAYRFIGEPS